MSLWIESIWNNKFFKLSLVIVLAGLTVLYTVPWIVTHSTEMEYSGVDFHDYWYAGHYLRQGGNAYAAIFNDPNPNYWDPRVPGSGDPNKPPSPQYLLDLPIYYLDGQVTESYPIAQTLIVAPSITAPLNLLIQLLAWFSWPTARFIWMMVGLLSAAVIPWLGLRLVDGHWKLSLMDKLVFALVFYNFYGLRQSIIIGQQTLICLLLLTLALLSRKNWWLAGFLLGLGVSKYSVGLPVFLYFFLRKEYRAILVSILIQALGILAIVPLKWGSPLETLTAYYRIFEVNYFQDGVYLLARFSGNWAKVAVFLLVFGTVGYFVGRQYFQNRALPETRNNLLGLNDLNLITLAIFMTTYHRIHDIPFMIFFFLPVIAILLNSGRPFWTPTQKSILYIGIGILAAILMFPTGWVFAVSRVENLFDVSELWGSVEAASSIGLLIMFGFSIWFQLKRLSHEEPPVFDGK